MSPLWPTILLGSVVAGLLCLGAANIVLRATWHEVEDGVLWAMTPEGVIVSEIALDGAGELAGLRVDDVLVAIDGSSVGNVADVFQTLHGKEQGSQLTYTVMRSGAKESLQIELQPILQGGASLYFLMAAVGVFTLLVGFSVRLRRPSDPATLHFFWLCVAFFGVFSFSFSGRLDRLDWILYWADIVSLLVLPPLFMHFSLVFPERPHAWVRSTTGRKVLPLIYLPAPILGIGRIAFFGDASSDGQFFTSLLVALDRLELLYLTVCLVGGLAVLIRTLGRVRSVTAKRQLRWIVLGAGFGAFPFTSLYLIPYVLGKNPVPFGELTVIPLGLVPLAFASAIVRYRLMDVEVIIKRALVYVAAMSAIAVMYAVLFRLVRALVHSDLIGGSEEQHNSVIAVLATLVVVLMASPVKNFIQGILDRVYYKDRYDYRQALVAFARELNSDLDLASLSERLVVRVRETLVIDRMALMLTGAGTGDAGGFGVIRSEGFDRETIPSLSHGSDVGNRLLAGQTANLDDPRSLRRFSHREIELWHGLGLHYFVPCRSKEGTIAVMALGRKEHGESLNSEDVALLAAVAGQVATAFENGRLYQQLGSKADELNRLREFSENIIDSLRDGLAVVNTNRQVVRWNQKLERLYGVSRDEAIGRVLESLFEINFVETLRLSQENREPILTEFRISLRSRHVQPKDLLVDVSAAPLKTPNGTTAGTILIFDDITSRVKLEEQLQISEKMASVGLLAAGVAHEVNTPLTGISSFTQMLLEGVDSDDPRKPLLEKIESQTFRAAKIVNSLLSLARPADVETGPVDLNIVVNDVLALLEHRFRRSNIELRKELSVEEPMVSGIEHKLQQVVLNLVMNALDAMPTGGWLSIRTAHENDSIIVDVSDTGSGIPGEHLSKIYDPFFTTKATGEGTGLGLSITYGIVQEHGGTITCQSSEGKGTRFSLKLPLKNESSKRSSETRA